MISKLRLMFPRNSGFHSSQSTFTCLHMWATSVTMWLGRLCWYVADKYLRDLKSSSSLSLSSRVLNGVVALSEFLVSEARILESGSEQAKKEAKEHIPSDRIKDAPAFARELRWRARHALGYQSDDEGSSSRNKSTTIVAGTKRRRVDDPEELPHFRNFKPKVWDAITTTVAEESQRVTKALRPTEGSSNEWTLGYAVDDVAPSMEDGEEANVSSRREVVVKVRRSAKGVERQRIERTVEEWRWDL